ncbi:MAG: hypothetical protein WCL29_08280 [Pseudomonadota bacterium]
MFEHISAPPIPRRHFVTRVMKGFCWGSALIAISLAAGMIGFLFFFPKMNWADAFVNTAMLLSGMGPLVQPENDAQKIFAGIYALYSGLVLLVAAGVIFAPVIHRFLHVMHADSDEDARPRTIKSK